MLYQLSYLGPSEAAATPDLISSEAPLPCPAYFWPEAGGGVSCFAPAGQAFFKDWTCPGFVPLL